jgi:hypothetical protein
LHATTGILPTKRITIPPDQFVAALRAIEVSFLSAPILMDKGQTEVAVPVEPGYTWSWLQMENGQWQEIPQANLTNDPNAKCVRVPQTTPTFSGAKEIRDGWLVLRANDSSKKTS